MIDKHPPLLNFREGIQPADVVAIRHLVAATGKFNDEELSIAVELAEERLNKGAASGYEFVLAQLSSEPNIDVTDQTTVVGFACYGKIPCTRSSYDLYWIVVDPAQQGRGIGKQLLSCVERRLQERQATQLYADTSGRDDYAGTRSYYVANGFQQAALLPDFYAPGDAKVIFRKLLL